ncbi:unnamed protein product [Dovyalis caffra]|uniref:non-specific serine/threonine protein kinase n=1 Tax=Dovyalis caffra TaxID=77055 RepID=A0AAV1S839_9ROSI|nr:unnamed protein product [Dovyalis caffra]
MISGNKRAPLDWNSRMKIAIGTARGVRYLHEDCRMGCVVHRDMRPNNILVTHDFEPLVADFGVARWHTECNISSEERVIGTSGYLASEYINSGKITETVDVFAFGVILLELMTEQLPEFAYQLQAMGLATSLCLHQDPKTRPPMSKYNKDVEGKTRGDSDERSHVPSKS